MKGFWLTPKFSCCKVITTTILCLSCLAPDSYSQTHGVWSNCRLAVQLVFHNSNTSVDPLKVARTPRQRFLGQLFFTFETAYLRRSFLFAHTIAAATFQYLSAEKVHICSSEVSTVEVVLSLISNPQSYKFFVLEYHVWRLFGHWYPNPQKWENVISQIPRKWPCHYTIQIRWLCVLLVREMPSVPANWTAIDLQLTEQRLSELFLFGTPGFL